MQSARAMGQFTGRYRGSRKRGLSPDYVPLDVERLREQLSCRTCGARPPKHHDDAPEACPGARPEVYTWPLLIGLLAQRNPAS